MIVHKELEKKKKKKHFEGTVSSFPRHFFVFRISAPKNGDVPSINLYMKNLLREEYFVVMDIIKISRF